MPEAVITLCIALQASYDSLAVAYLTRAAASANPEIARQVDLSEIPSVSAHMLKEIEAQLLAKNCPRT